MRSVHLAVYSTIGWLTCGLAVLRSCGKEAALQYAFSYIRRYRRGIWINGEPAGESHVTIGLSAQYGIPTALITGDQVVCGEIGRWMGGEIETAVVKESYTRYVARCLPLHTARDRIREAAARAVSRVQAGKARLGGYPLPVTLEVELDSAQTARYVSLVPTAHWDGGKRVRFEAPTFLEAYCALMCAFWIAESRLTP